MGNSMWRHPASYAEEGGRPLFWHRKEGLRPLQQMSWVAPAHVVSHPGPYRRGCETSPPPRPPRVMLVWMTGNWPSLWPAKDPSHSYSVIPILKDDSEHLTHGKLTFSETQLSIPSPSATFWYQHYHHPELEFPLPALACPFPSDGSNPSPGAGLRRPLNSFPPSLRCPLYTKRHDLLPRPLPPYFYPDDIYDLLPTHHPE